MIDLSNVCHGNRRKVRAAPKRGWWQLRQGRVHIFVCEGGAFVIWQTNWQQDVHSDSQGGTFFFGRMPGGHSLSAFMYARNSGGQATSSSPGLRERWSELNWIGAKWSEVEWRTDREMVRRCRCAYILSGSGCVCVCVRLRHVAHFIFQVINQFSAPLKMKTKNENERTKLKLTLTLTLLSSGAKKWIPHRGALWLARVTVSPGGEATVGASGRSVN